MTDGEMKWISGNLIESQKNVTIGILPQYTRKIPWYPSVVGNHTLHVSAGETSEKQLNVSVGFDVEGIITPSLGCPTILSKTNTNELSIALSEERSITEEPAQIAQVTLQSVDGTGSYQLDGPNRGMEHLDQRRDQTSSKMKPSSHMTLPASQKTSTISQ